MLTGSQTVGPYYFIGMEPLCDERVPIAGEAETVTIEGQLIDGAGQPIPDGILEIWQADLSGNYSAEPATQPEGFTRISTAPDGNFRFTTTRPGPVPYDADQIQSPHLLVLVYMRGLLRNLVTRMYFPDEASNATDPILQLVPVERRQTLIAQPKLSGSAPNTLYWNIIMRNNPTQQETVFFAW